MLRPHHHRHVCLLLLPIQHLAGLCAGYQADSHVRVFVYEYCACVRAWEGWLGESAFGHRKLGTSQVTSEQWPCCGLRVWRRFVEGVNEPARETCPPCVL